jgi:phage protein D
MAGEYSSVYSPRFEVVLGSTTYQEVGGLIRDLTVEMTVEGADLCSFTLTHPFDPEQGDFADMEWSDVEPGADVEVSLGWGGEGSIEPLFVGTSRSVRTEFAPGSGASVAVSGYGPLHEMMRGVVERSWSDTTVVAVAEEVLGEYFSTVEVEGSASNRKRVIQHDQNDYRFVRGLAEEYGFEFYAERDTAYFTPRSAVGSGDANVTLTYGNTLDTFSAEVSTADQVGSVEVRYWDMNAEKEIVGSASKETGEGKEVFRIACDSKQEADNIAAGKLSSLSMSRATGHGETDGIPELTAGTVLRIEGVGERFTGNYYVTRVSHRMGGSGYRTSFDVTELPE